jgi:hypothetical protein
MTKKLTDRSKTLFRYESRQGAKQVIEQGYLLPKAFDHYTGIAFAGIDKGITIWRIDDSVDVDGNKRRGSEAPCIFLTESYPFYESNIGVSHIVTHVFPIEVSSILDQGFTIYRSPRRGCGNVWIVPDSDYKPLLLDVSKVKKLNIFWDLYTMTLAPYVCLVNMARRGIRNRREGSS